MFGFAFGFISELRKYKVVPLPVLAVEGVEPVLNVVILLTPKVPFIYCVSPTLPVVMNDPVFIVEPVKFAAYIFAEVEISFDEVIEPVI